MYIIFNGFDLMELENITFPFLLGGLGPNANIIGPYVIIYLFFISLFYFC